MGEVAWVCALLSISLCIAVQIKRSMAHDLLATPPVTRRVASWDTDPLKLALIKSVARILIPRATEGLLIWHKRGREREQSVLVGRHFSSGRTDALWCCALHNCLLYCSQIWASVASPLQHMHTRALALLAPDRQSFFLYAKPLKSWI